MKPVSAADPPPLDFEEFVDVLRLRISLADAMKPNDLHDFRKLMSDYAEVTPDGWWKRAFERLDDQGHLDPASGMAGGPSPFARLSDAGQTYVESQQGTA